MKGMNKRGIGSGVALLIMVLVIAGGVTALVLTVRSGPVQQTAIPDEVIQDQVVAAAKAEKKSSQLTLIAKDYASNTLARLDVPAYCVKTEDGLGEKQDVTQQLKGAQGDSLSTSSAKTISGIDVGDKGYCVPFNASYYGDVQTWESKSEGGESLTLRAYNANDDHVGLDFFEDGSRDGPPVTIDIRGDATNTFNKLVVLNNVSDVQFRLRVIGVDVNTNSNITNIVMTDTEEFGKPIKRLRNVLDYAFDVGVVDDRIDLQTGETVSTIGPRILNEFDEYETNSVQITGDSDGCGSQEETPVWYLIDEQKFVSNVDGSIKSGVEDDQSDSADVGVGDILNDMTCS